ncbi:MAG TPA: amidohydrolase family protein, partial [Paludibacteraceae bacterium]|nr:amidohydrolase family protein [Paludibacteraceae bacterium]
MSIFIKNIQLNGLVTHIKIEGNRFSKIRTDATPSTSDTIIDGTDKAILPPFYNTHTHSPMSLLRGYADDLPLFTWLNDYIWPFEAKLTPDDIYIGTRLSILEMIKSGTVFFNDMYWKEEATIRAAKEMGIRAAIG